jgi:hypothetical protein
MLLREFKRKNRYTTQEMADMFNTTHRNIYYWMSINADIKGKTGERVITLTKVLAEEQAIEVVK